MPEKYSDLKVEVRSTAISSVQNMDGLYDPVASCDETEGLLQGVLDAGFAVFSIDTMGYVQRLYGTSRECLEELDIWNDPPSRFQILDEWNRRLWACITDVPDQSPQLKLIDPHGGYTGVVAWSNEKPSVLEVGLTSLDRLGLKLDPVWRQLIFRGSLD